MTNLLLYIILLDVGKNQPVVMDVEFNYEDQNHFELACKYVYFCSRVGHFNMEVDGDLLHFEASPLWSVKELQFF